MHWLLMILMAVILFLIGVKMERSRISDCVTSCVNTRIVKDVYTKTCQEECEAEER